MERSIYARLAQVFGILLVIIGIAAFVGGNFAKSFVGDQLADQHITMPTEEVIQGQVDQGRLTEEDAQVLLPFAGEPMSTGAHAKAYADNYIRSHMAFAAQEAGVPDANYASLGGLYGQEEAALIDALKADNPDASDDQLAKMAAAEIQNPLTTYDQAQRAAELENLRYGIFLDGNTLRGMLLNAYGWGLLGNIAFAAGILLALAGLALLLGGIAANRKTDRI